MLRSVLKSQSFSALAFVAFLCGGAQLARAAEDVLNLLHQGIPHDALYDVCFEGNNGIAVGVAGTVLNSSDGGASWQPEKPVTDQALLGITCSGASPIAVGQSGHVQVKAAEGWQVTTSGSDQRLLSVAADSSGLAVAVGGFGTVLRSRDSGRTWEQLPFDWEAILNDFLEPHIYDVSILDDGTLVIVGEFQLVLISNDRGDSWEVLNKASSSLFSVDFYDRQNGYAVGQDGTLIKTADGGSSWQMIKVPTRENLLDVWSSSGGEVFVSGIRTLLHSRDYGKSWESITAGDVPVKWYQAVAGLKKTGAPERVVMVGHSGRVLEINN